MKVCLFIAWEWQPVMTLVMRHYLTYDHTLFFTRTSCSPRFCKGVGNIQENEAKIPQTSSILTHIFIMEIGRLFYISEQFSNTFIIYLIRI